MGFFVQIAKVAAVALPLVAGRPSCEAPLKQIKCGGKDYTYKKLAGYGALASNSTDKYGDTLGGWGSGVAFERGSWERDDDGSYSGIIYAVPDRGWNTNGTLNFQSRIHKLEITFKPDNKATVQQPGKPNLKFKYLDSVLITDPAGNPTTGLDADARGPYLSFPGINFTFPSATYPGDGFNGAGPGGKRVSVDAEGLVIDRQGNFWVSDEYGPSIYKINKDGRMLSAIKPPDAFIPRRNSSTSYASNNPPLFDQTRVPRPTSPSDGRNNNQGFEGLTISPDGKTLYVLLQSATIQDGGSSNPTRRNTRFLAYDISGKEPKAIAEHVVQLPFTPDGRRVVAQSEVHYVNPSQFLILSRDSGFGAGLGNATNSTYRHADVFDISKATNVLGRNGTDRVAGQVATVNGTLLPGITPAEYCSFIDYNVNSQLNRFGVRNGGPQGAGLLNEKWESFALLPVDGDKGSDGEFFLLSVSDNDFITQDGYQNFGKYRYKDASGANLDNQALVFRVKLPVGGR